MYSHVYTISPSQQAANGALRIFVEGCQKDDVRQQLFGLPVLQSATEAQVHAAMPYAQASLGVAVGEIHAMLAR